MHHAEPVREKLFTMRMSAEEWARAEALAKHYGVTMAALFRMILLEKERTLAEPARQTPTRKSSRAPGKK